MVLLRFGGVQELSCLLRAHLPRRGLSVCSLPFIIALAGCAGMLIGRRLLWRLTLLWRLSLRWWRLTLAIALPLTLTLTLTLSLSTAPATPTTATAAAAATTLIGRLSE